MAFRANEAAQTGYEQVDTYFTSHLQGTKKSRGKEVLLDIIDELGPVVGSYPTWHPLVCNHDKRYPTLGPSKKCGYKGLDHTRFFRNGFITCPYTASGGAEKVIESVSKLPCHPVATITAERLDVQLYNSEATPILVKCEWHKPLEIGGMIPLSIAMPLILEQEIPCWRWAQVAETWENMRSSFLGNPHGSRSSLFVSQETGQAIKKIWNALIYTGMFGPIKV